MNYIYRQGKMFKINLEILPEKSKRSDILNALYAALYDEFAGAAINKKYKNYNNQQKMQAVNSFAESWLKKRNLL